MRLWSYDQTALYKSIIIIIIIIIIIGSQALSFSGLLLSVDVEFCGFVCLFVRNFEVKYLENERS